MVYNGIHIRKVREILTELNRYTMTKENYTLLMWKKLEYKDIYFEDLEFEEVQKIEKVIDLAFSLYSVSQQRELLNRFFDWEDMIFNGKLNDREQNNKYIDEFLKSI